MGEDLKNDTAAQHASEPPTKDQCADALKMFILREKEKLEIFYKDDSQLDRPAETAAKMVQELMKQGCKKEMALRFATLTLYDLVILLGMLSLFPCFVGCLCSHESNRR
jgi:hypothetical protein